MLHTARTQVVHKHQKHTHAHPDLTLSSVLATKENGAGEGVRAGDVDERGPGAGVPGGGRRRVRARAHRLRRRRAQEVPTRPAKRKQTTIRRSVTVSGSGDDF